MTFVVGARAGCVGRGDHGADRGGDGGPHGHALTDAQAHADAHREADPNPHRQADDGADGHGDGRTDDRADDRADTAPRSPTPAPTPKPTPKPTPAPTPAPTPTPGADLTGIPWQLTAVTLRDPAFQGVVPADQQANYTINFATDGTFSARADCNTVSGGYTVTSSGGLTLSPGPTTTVACAEGSYSDLYIIGLTSARSYVVANNQLTITMADGGTLQYRNSAS